MDLNLIMCQPALVLITRYRYSTSRTILAWRGVLTHPSHPHPWLRACWGTSNSLVDFIMHKYLHKYFENIKKTRKIFFIRNMRPLSIREAPRPGLRGVLPPALSVAGKMLYNKFSRLRTCCTTSTVQLVRWRCPLVVLYNMSAAGVRVVEFGT